jgi:hypothetical protein
MEFGAMGFAARVSCVSVRQSFLEIFSHRAGAAAGIHRPAPMMIVVTPSFVVELAYVKLPPWRYRREQR